MRFCTHAENDWYRIYLVRRLANQYGMECAQRLANEAESGWIFPEEIIQQQVKHTHLLSRTDLPAVFVSRGQFPSLLSARCPWA